MGLLDPLRPKWKNSDADVRLAAAQQLEDPAILCKVIVDDPEWFVRHNVLVRLREVQPDQKWYAQLVHSSGDEEIRRKVVKVMTDVSVLEGVAKNDQYRYVRDAAQHRIDEIQSGTWDDDPVAAGAAPDPA